MNVMVRYDNGTQLNYALSAYDAWEGNHIAFNGTKGRLEHRLVEKVGTAGAGETQSMSAGVSTRIIRCAALRATSSHGPAPAATVPATMPCSLKFSVARQWTNTSRFPTSGAAPGQP